MRHRTPLLGGAGLVTVGLAVGFVVRPRPLLASLPEAAVDAVGPDVVVPVLAGVLGVYAGWVVLTTGGTTTSPVTSEDAADTDDTEGDDATEADARDDASSGGPSAITLLGVEVVRFTSASDGDGGDEGAGAADAGADTDPAPTCPDRYVSEDVDAFECLRERPPETVTDDGGTVVGRRFDGALADAATSTRSAHDVREALRDVVVDVETGRGGADRERAEAAVDAGEWTDDRVAAAFVAAGDEVTYPLRQRLHAWVDPAGAFDGRVRRTTAAVRASLDDREAGP